MYKLLRIHYEGVGHREARFDPLALDFRGDTGESPLDSAVWLRNGGGKTSLLALFFSLLQTRRTDFLGGGRSVRRSTRPKRLEDYVLSGDVGHVVAEWGQAPGTGQPTLDGARQTRRLVTGQVLFWRRSGGQESIESHYYAFEPRLDVLELDDLPFRRDPRHRTPAGEFIGFLGRAGQTNPSLGLVETDSQRKWQDYLGEIGLDPEIIRYQLSMNEHEGGAEEFLDFRDGDSFVAFLLRLVADPTRAQQVQQNIGKTAQRFAERPNLQLELAFAEGVLERLPSLSASHERARAAEESRRVAVTTGRRLLGRLGTATAAASRARAEQLTRRAALDEQLKETLVDRDTWRDWVSALERQAALLRLAEGREARDATRAEVERLDADARAWSLVEEIRRERVSAARVSELRVVLARVLADAAGLRRAFEVAAARYRLRLAGQVEALVARADEAERETRAATDRAEAAQSIRSAATARLAAISSEERSVAAQLKSDRRRLESLVSAGARRPSESVCQALERIEHDIADNEERQREITTEQVELEARRGSLSDERRAREVQLAGLTSDLQHGRDERERLAARVARVLAIPEVAEWTEGAPVRIQDVATALQAHLATQAGAADHELLLLELELTAARRAAHSLRATRLLPPSDDVERACELLAATNIAAESGYAYLERNYPLERREALLTAAPDLALGVIVNPGDVGRAVQVLTGKFLPGQPLTLAEGGAWLAASENDRPTGTWHVIAPSPAHHDPTVAATELLRFEALIRDSEARRERLVGRRDRLREAGAALEDLLSVLPAGGIEDLDRLIASIDASRASAAAEAAGLGERLAATTATLASLDRERQTLVASRLRLGDWRGRLEDARPLDEQIPEREARLLELGDERRSTEAERDAAEETMRQERQAADAARARMVRASSDRAVRQADLDRVAADASGEDVAVADDPTVDDQRLEEEYRINRELYERQTSGSETALQLKVAEESLGAIRARLVGEPADRIARANEYLDTAAGITPAASRDAARRADDLANEARERLGAREAEVGDAQKELRKTTNTPVELPVELRASTHREATVAYEGGLRRHSELRSCCADLEAERGVAAGLAERAGDRARLLGILAESLRSAVDEEGEFAGPNAEVENEDEIDPEAAQVEVPNAVAASRAASRALEEAAAELRRSVRVLDTFVRQDSFAPITGPLRDAFHFDRDEHLAAAAGGIRDEFARRLVWIRKDLEDLQAHRSGVAQALLVLVKEAFTFLDRAESFRLPDGLGEWSRHPYLQIAYPRPEPELLGSRLEAYVDELMQNGVDRLPESVVLLIAAVRRAVGDQRFEVRVLKPNEGLPRTRASVAEIASWSGGQKLTTALLLYCVLVHLRGLSRRGQRSLQISTLLLDNPIGTANHVDLVDLQLKVARALGVQLIVTTGIADHDALAAYPNVIRLRNLKDRHSGRGYVRLEGLSDATDGAGGGVEAARVFRRAGHEVSG